MKIRRFHKQTVLALSLVIWCAACGSQGPKAGSQTAKTIESDAAVDSGNFFVGARPIYAHLVNNKDGSWAFRTITTSDETAADGYLVRLNDLTAAFDTRIAECTPQVYPESHRCNPMNPFRDEDSGILDKIINGTIAVGTGGQIKDVTYRYETTFDETAFNQAVDAALLNTDLDQRRLIALLTTYDAEVDSARLQLHSASERVQAVHTASTRPELDVQPTVAGLTQYYEGDIDFTQLIDLEVTDEMPVAVTELPAPAILPCDARRCIAEADAALAALRINLQLSLQSIEASMQPASKTYKVRCDVRSYASYLLQADCPAQLVAADAQPVQVPINVVILSRDFDDLYPAMEVSDEKLSISVDGKTVTFFNTTSEYLTLSAQTVYYNSTVNTTALPIDIPPGISVTYDLDDFTSQSIDIESRYLQMTPDKAQRASFRFGFAVRYQLASESAGQTLHAMDTFNVDCAIRNRIQPGSCQSESVAEAGKTEDNRLPRTPM
jgi:hypothetical protein